MNYEQAALSGSAPEDADLFQQFLAAWLARAAPALADAARYAALPHSFDAALLSTLRGTVEDTDGLIANLLVSGLLVSEAAEAEPADKARPPGSQGDASAPQAGSAAVTRRYRVEGSFRRPLLFAWQTERPAAYREASARLVEFYTAGASADEAAQVERVYHLLGAGAAGAIAALEKAFEAAWATRRASLAERLLEYASEQTPVLDREMAAWLRYLGARLDLWLGRRDEAERTLRELSAETYPPRVRARAAAALGDVLAATQRWDAAQRDYDGARVLFAGLGERREEAQVLLAQGMAYVGLAGNLGGLLPEEPRAISERRVVWFRTLSDAPFLLYRWLSRRVAPLPNLYFGTDYQDWIILRLLYEAIDRLERAARLLAVLAQGDNGGSADVERSEETVDGPLADTRIRLAELYHRVGSWSTAERAMARLAETPAVQANAYRRATLLLAQGRAALERGQADVAQLTLAEARALLAGYGDRRGVATADRLLGDVAMAVGTPSAAVPYYAESVETARAADDLLGATHAWAVLAAIAARLPLDDAARARIAGLRAAGGPQAYIARFPGALHARFRNMAAFVALPLTYVMLPLLLLALVVLSAIVEAAVRSLAGGVRPGQFSAAFFILLGLPLFVLWFYQGVYLLTGWVFVRRLPLRSLALRQPAYLVTAAEGIAMLDESGTQHEIAWARLDRWISLDRWLWRTPVGLISRQLLAGGETTLVLEGILGHYPHLCQDIADRLARAGSAVRREEQDLSFLRSWWSLVALASMVLASVDALTGWPVPAQQAGTVISQLGSGQGGIAPIASVLFQFTIWGMLFFPVVALVRLLANRAAARRTLGRWLPLGPEWPMWLALVLILLVTLILLSSVFQITR